MKPDPATVPITTLLSHRDWVRRLARSLASDEASVDDLVQGTWLRAIRTPPLHAGSARSWLARVVRGLAFNAHRAEGRRATHERAGARPEHVRSAAEVLAEAEIHKRLVVAVLDLDEPYRSTVLMRFFEGMPPREIAKCMDVPVETARTRLRRALITLREELSNEGGGASWLAAIAPLVALPCDASSGAGISGATAAGITGGTVMTGKATVVVAATLALAAGFAGGKMSGGATPSAPSGEVAALNERIAALESIRGPLGSLAAPVELRSGPSLGGSGTAAPNTDAPDLGHRLQALEADLAAARKSNAALVAWASGLGPPPRDAEAELKRLEGMSNEELLAVIRRLSVAQYKTEDEQKLGLDRIVQACGAFLARKSEPSPRAEVLVAEGSAWVRMRDADKAEPVLKEALQLVDPASSQAHSATIQLAFAASSKNDNRRASDLMFGLACQAETTPGERA